MGHTGTNFICLLDQRFLHKEIDYLEEFHVFRWYRGIIFRSKTKCLLLLSTANECSIRYEKVDRLVQRLITSALYILN